MITILKQTDLSWDKFPAFSLLSQLTRHNRYRKTK